MLNKVFLIGRLTKDPEIKFTPNGAQITEFSIAVNKSYKVNDEWEEETYFFDIVSFGYLAERLGKQLSKGSQVLIEGSLRQDRWTSDKGEYKSKVKVIADKVSILSKKNNSENTPSQNQTNEDEDIPF